MSGACRFGQWPPASGARLAGSGERELRRQDDPWCRDGGRAGEQWVSPVGDTLRHRRKDDQTTTDATVSSVCSATGPRLRSSGLVPARRSSWWTRPDAIGSSVPSSHWRSCWQLTSPLSPTTAEAAEAARTPFRKRSSVRSTTSLRSSPRRVARPPCTPCPPARSSPCTRSERAPDPEAGVVRAADRSR
jgi:hypothetical protein